MIKRFGRWVLYRVLRRTPPPRPNFRGVRLMKLSGGGNGNPGRRGR